ncbi:hypothetical protein [Jatrophihabitans sp.]|uniref:hypothetical protein n=1 Tax=Jatrophihabitans sp. TaxID=1932789 RepID=UPI0030C66EDD|nr:hypothetical protein [Jatrophihabitans sp.]
MTTPGEAYNALRDVGINPTLAATLTAIGGAESHWNTSAQGDLGIQTAKWGPSYGVWQIRTLKADTGKGTARDINFLRQGLFAQAAAVSQLVKNKSGLNQWSTYKNGSYKKFTAQARTAAKGYTVPKAAAPKATTPAPDPTYDNGNTWPGSPYAGKGGGGGGGGAVAGGATSVGFLDGGVFPGGPLDPLNWAGSLGGNVASSAAESVWGLVQPFAITAMFALGGIALVVVGLAVTAEPTRQRVESAIDDKKDDAASAAKALAVVA